MSGTSMDGIDAALIQTDGTPQQIQSIGHVYLPYDPLVHLLFKAAEFGVRKHRGQLDPQSDALHQAISDYLHQHAAQQGQTPSTTLAAMQTLLGHSPNASIIQLEDVIQLSTRLHAKAAQTLLQKTQYRASQIDVIGYHGQTLWHHPSTQDSVIIGDGAYLAQALKITVVNDFRSQDIATGGQGAPFAPLYHQALAVRDNVLPVAIVNCGGIANITFIPNDNVSDLLGFDTGPGNALIDTIVRQRTNEHMDRNGQYGSQSTLNTTELNLLLKKLYDKTLIRNSQNYFKQVPPKSLDYGDFELTAELDTLSLADVCYVLEVFTADTIVDSLKFLEPHHPPPQTWILAGGGWSNPVITTALKQKLTQRLGKQVHIQTADEMGWHNQALEAELFAYLAVRSLRNLPLSYPNTTGVPQPQCGGTVFQI